jgi:hypothetical protein
MTSFHVTESAKNIKVLGLSENARTAASLAQFGNPVSESDRVYLLKSGLKGAAHMAASCMGWIWRQWLLGTPRPEISSHVAPFVARGLELRRLSESYDKLALHDLYLLHCAIFGCDENLLKSVVEEVAGTSGDKGEIPSDDGELYAAAWCGVLKHWILGDAQLATQQADQIWGAVRNVGVFAASKPLVVPWLKRDWKAFVKLQQKDFQRLWSRARKDHWTIKAEDSTEIVVTTHKYQIEHQWCWAHCGMALLAHREGVEVATDPFWFPPSALKESSPSKKKTQEEHPDQLRMF